MALTFLLDEHLRGPLWHAIIQHNQQGGIQIDILRVGDPRDLPLGSSDPDILIWAEREGRIVISLDRNSMPGHFLSHLQSGRHSPGLLLVHPFCGFTRVVAELALITHAGNPADYFDQIGYIP